MDAAMIRRCSNAASFSGRVGLDCSLPAQRRWRAPLRPCRVTNSEEEMKDPREPLAYSEDFINLGPQFQVPRPELGTLEERVERTFVEAMFSDEISAEDTNYWFTEPEEGWNSSDVIAHKLREEPVDVISAAHFAPGRTELTELQEGAVMTGEVTCLMYYHGVQVDLGAQYDGLIPVRQEQWQDDHFRSKWGVSTGVSADFCVGQQVTVRIHKINHRPRCRWPIQLVVLDPDVQHKLTPPDEWNFPFDLRGVKSYDEAFQITGRPRDPEYVAMPEWVARTDTFDTQLMLKSKELSSMAYGQKPVEFDGLKMSDDIFDLLANHTEEQQRELPVDITEDAEHYDESYSSV